MGCGYLFSNFGLNNPNAWWWMLGVGLVHILVVVGVIILIVKLISKMKYTNSTTNKSVSILKQKFALGEINEEEYKNKINVLKK